MPYIEGANIADSIQETLEAFVNDKDHDPDLYDPVFRDLNDVAAEFYQCPSDDPNELLDKYFQELAASSYVGIAGSAFSRNDDGSLGTDPEVRGYYDGPGAVNYDGVFHMGTGTELRRILDGQSNTLLAGERWYSVRAWTIGAYWVTKVPSSGGGRFGGGTRPTGPYHGQYYFAFKNVDKRYPINAPLDAVGYYVGHERGWERVELPPGGKTTMALNDLLFASFHPGGANFAYCDGSVHFLPDNIDLEVYEALASKDGQESISLQQ